jgi:hypothetical protein
LWRRPRPKLGCGVKERRRRRRRRRRVKRIKRKILFDSVQCDI